MDTYKSLGLGTPQMCRFLADWLYTLETKKTMYQQGRVKNEECLCIVPLVIMLRCFCAFSELSQVK